MRYMLFTWVKLVAPKPLLKVFLCMVSLIKAVIKQIVSFKKLNNNNNL